MMREVSAKVWNEIMKRPISVYDGVHVHIFKVYEIFYARYETELEIRDVYMQFWIIMHSVQSIVFVNKES